MVNVCETIGRIAIAAPTWRLPLGRALETLNMQLRTTVAGNSTIHKYLLWAYAATTGLKPVLEEMRHQSQSAAVQDAAICALIDVLDDDLAGEYSLTGAENVVAEVS